MALDPGIWMYVTPLSTILGGYLLLRTKKERKSRRVRDNAVKTGMIEPASIHPAINHNRCIGCGSCVAACPEHPGHSVLGLINGKSHLIGPTDCIGHGACFDVCPADAITLVFGTERRGVDIPMVKPDFETNVPGIYIAGELGGMGLIKNAIEQGRQALENIAKLEGRAEGDMLDVLIVGVGPAGFAASLGAMEAKLKYATIEQDSLGGTVYQFPRGKIVMTAPATLPMVGKVMFRETTKEKLLEFWEGVEKDTGVKINYKERVDAIEKIDKGFKVTTSKGVYETRTVLLTIGRRGTPRKLGVTGEDLPKVMYRLIDPEQFKGQKVLVVGGGDSALEAATSIAAEEATEVTLSYRSAAFSRAKEKNRQKVKDAEEAGRLKVLMTSNVKLIEDKSVKVEHNGEHVDIENDAIIISAGGILPTAFLKKVGISVEAKFGTP
ncbi:MAG: NAD(P)-binding domain-containing protein [Thermodesulfobacteriota bacterium]